MWPSIESGSARAFDGRNGGHHNGLSLPVSPGHPPSPSRQLAPPTRMAGWCGLRPGSSGSFAPLPQYYRCSGYPACSARTAARPSVRNEPACPRFPSRLGFCLSETNRQNATGVMDLPLQGWNRCRCHRRVRPTSGTGPRPTGESSLRKHRKSPCWWPSPSSWLCRGRKPRTRPESRMTGFLKPTLKYSSPYYNKRTFRG